MAMNKGRSVSRVFPFQRAGMARACFAIAALAGASLFAETYWLDTSVNYNNSKTGYINPLTNAYNWVAADGVTHAGAAGTTIPSDGIYYLRGNQTLGGEGIVRVRYAATYNFAELHIGELSTSRQGKFLHAAAGKTVTLSGETHLECGNLVCHNSNDKTFTLYGNFNVRAPDSASFPMAAGYQRCTMNLQGSFSSDVGCGLKIGGNNGFATADPDNNTYNFETDFSEYFGTLRLYNDDATARVGSAAPQRFAFRTSTSIPGTVVVSHDSLVSMPVAGTSLVVANLSLGSNDMLKFSATGASASCLVVTNSFSHDGAIEVELELKYERSSNAVTNRLLTVPIAAAFGMDDLQCHVSSPSSSLPFESGFSIVTNEVAGTCSLVHSYRYLPEGAVYLLNSDSGDKANNKASHYTSALTNALSWSDGNVPGPGKDYYVCAVDGNGCWLRTLQGGWTDGEGHTATDYTFAGDSLSLMGQGIALCSERIRFNRLRLYGSSTILSTFAQPSTKYLSGNVEVVSGTASLKDYGNQMLVLDGTVSGSGNLRLDGVDSTGSPLGNYSFRNADMSAFKGRIIVSNHSGNANPDFVNTNQTFHVWSAASLGGPLDEFDPAALTLERCGTLRARASFAVTTNCNRGITVTGAGRIIVDTGFALDVQTPMAVSGLLRKNGAGVLRMDGPLSAGTEDGVDNVLELMAGTLRLAHSEAINGLSVEVAADTAIVIELDPSDAGRAAAGIRMEKSRTPFTLPEAMDVLPLTLAVVGDAPADAQSFTHGIFTVTNDPEVVASTKAMLPELPAHMYHGYDQELVESEDAEAGTHTFAIRFAKRGMKVILL